MDAAGGMDGSPGRLTVENQTLKQSIQQAYSVKGYLISGGPGWIDSETYDIIAKAPSGAGFGQMLPMFQVLLEDRFQLKFHRQTGELPGYELIVGKSGAKFRQTGDDDPRRASFITRSNEFRGPKVPMGYFANYLAGVLSAPVLDRTNLPGKYEVTLLFTPDGRQPVAPDGPSSAPLVTAIQEQLGLKLVAAKVPAERFIIDRAERPPEN